MNEEPTNETQAPESATEEMKMPENTAAPTITEEKSAASGVIILILGVLLIGILAGLYLWFVSLNNEATSVTETVIERPTDEENNEPESETAEARTDNMETVSTSDEITAIEADLEATNFEALDAELNSLDAEFEATGSN